MFSRENYSLGIWKPLDFFRDIGGGLVMLQPYEANKLPDGWNWPKSIPYYLVFSFEEGSGSDGVVPLDSQLHYQLQLEARHMYGFVDTHVGTLSDERFIELFNRLMDESLGQRLFSALPKASGG